MKTKTASASTDKDSLYSYIERANVPKSHSKLVKIARFKGVVFAATMSMCIALLDVYRRFDILDKGSVFCSFVWFCFIMDYVSLGNSNGQNCFQWGSKVCPLVIGGI